MPGFKGRTNAPLVVMGPLVVVPDIVKKGREMVGERNPFYFITQHGRARFGPLMSGPT